ncbi:class I SAM-dependent methyltransferase [Herbiconiux sp. CPCC 205763]|uniref:Class I SAM-dependent methyltransferase n=1 Tax=Herbiconiux aconitum TaxID=2970913 RepID=A0ABT2GPE3_9MICO|nr:class I SAM-dependent methyltransferase [Herbiconiux aconitum]MCS5718053.1 class I SAM-dependent methyltransferase [Herbiconiux aconitum]
MNENTETDATAFWEGRYREREQIWSGRANRALVDVVDQLAVPPGRALDLGSGEGADSIWLAEHGWQVTGVDISGTALSRAGVHASDRGVADRITWLQADLASWTPPAEYDLVSACFLHSPVAFPREEVLRHAAGAVAAGGYLLVVGHAGFPPWSRDSHDEAGGEDEDVRAPGGEHEHGGGHGGEHAHGNRHTHGGGQTDSHAHGHDDLPTPAQVRESLALPEDAWETVIAENRSREATGPDGQQAVLDDAILLLRRRD